MSHRNSGYARMAGDTYVTPRWVYQELLSVESFEGAWDPAPVNADFDFLESQGPAPDIATNPPFSIAEQFIRHALSLTESTGGKVAMLLPMAYDCAKGRRDLFEKPPFKAKYTLTKRIRWTNLEQKAAGPSMNHAWFVWDWSYEGRSFMGWLPTPAPLPSIPDAPNTTVGE